MSDMVMQSYVWHEGKCFFVSTINRESSAALAYGRRYAETLVWEYDYEKRERGGIVGQAEDSEGGITAHMQTCKKFNHHGHMNDEDA